MVEIKNIYDNDTFLKGYLDIRANENNHNNLIEQPSMKKHLPNVEGKEVLDLGCGYGNNAMDFIEKGAKGVTGVDISTKMLEIAKSKNSHPCIQYLNMDMADIGGINKKFDLVYSSLAFHYVENFPELLKNIYNLLNEGGILLFSQEHPITTATLNGEGNFNKNENKEYLSYTFSNYNQSGKRIVNWFVDGVLKYHRTFSDIINAIIDTGFKIIAMEEPTPTIEIIEKVPRMAKELIKPSFLILKVEK